MALKILILGAPNSGKKTILEEIEREEIEFQSFDYEKIVLKDQVDYLLRLSGEDHLSLINRKLNEKIDGIILVVDNQTGLNEDDQGILNLIQEKSITYIVFANKQDLKSGSLNVNTEALVIPTIATKKIGVNDGLNLLLEIIEQNGTYRQESSQESSYHKLRIDEQGSEFCEVKFSLHHIKFENVKKTLETEGFSNITVTQIKFIDKNLATEETYRSYEHLSEYPEKLEIMMVTQKDNIPYICKALASIKTEYIDDSMVINPVENVIRIRTKEEGENAIE